MFVTTTSVVGEFISPFGSQVKIPSGVVTELDVENFFWLALQPAVEVKYQDDAEAARAEALLQRLRLNPLKGLPVPQHLEPNASLHLDGFATRVPVVVINPVGLFAEVQPGYEFTTPNPTLFVDPEALRDLVTQVVAQVLSPEGKKTEPAKANSKTKDDKSVTTEDV